MGGFVDPILDGNLDRADHIRARLPILFKSPNAVSDDESKLLRGKANSPFRILIRGKRASIYQRLLNGIKSRKGVPSKCSDVR